MARNPLCEEGHCRSAVPSLRIRPPSVLGVSIRPLQDICFPTQPRFPRAPERPRRLRGRRQPSIIHAFEGLRSSSHQKRSGSCSSDLGPLAKSFSAQRPPKQAQDACPKGALGGLSVRGARSCHCVVSFLRDTRPPRGMPTVGCAFPSALQPRVEQTKIELFNSRD